jgi:hypothetical protein
MAMPRLKLSHKYPNTTLLTKSQCHLQRCIFHMLFCADPTKHTRYKKYSMNVHCLKKRKSSDRKYPSLIEKEMSDIGTRYRDKVELIASILEKAAIARNATA